MRILLENFRRIRMIGIGVLVLGILLLPGFAAAASPQKISSLRQSSEAGWEVFFLPTFSHKLCVGQKVTLVVDWGPSPGLLQPLTTLSSIHIKSSNNNSIDPKEIRPMERSGTADSIFEAKKAGTDTITATLFTYNFKNNQEENVATDTTTIKVLEKCKYSFFLEAILNVKFEKGGVSESLRYEIHSGGILEAQDPEHPELLTAKNVSIVLQITITELTVPDCALLGQDAGMGYGHSDANAEIWSDGKKIHLTVGPPADFKWVKNAIGRCGDASKNVTVGGTWESEANLVDGVDFSAGGGTLPIKMEIFEQGLRNAAKGGGTGSYTAKVTLKAEDNE